MKKFLLALAILAALALFSRIEHTFHYNLDSLAVKRYETFRFLGIPIFWSLKEFEPGNPSEFQAVSGYAPLESHWLNRPADHVRSLWMNLDLCYGFPNQSRERMDLLKALYQKLPSISRETAVKLYKEIDERYPATTNYVRFDPFSADPLRIKLGLKPLYSGTNAAEQDAAANP